MYMLGRGVSKDEGEAAKWIRKAADQGLAMAQYNLGSMYENGQGVTKDKNLAIEWYRKAALQGYPLALESLRPTLIKMATANSDKVSLPAPGSTFADIKLQRDALMQIMYLEAVLNKSCTAYLIRNTEAVEPFRDAKTKWTERWTLDRCGIALQYEIQFTPAQGGTYVMVPSRWCKSVAEVEPNCALQFSR
jgi:hypothetical protein